jgi:hypothetical protein
MKSIQAEMADEFSMQELKEELERLKKENTELKKDKKQPGISWKISEKGALSIYGLGRFPVTLYKSQWEQIFEKKDELKQFMDENKSKLATKEK